MAELKSIKEQLLEIGFLTGSRAFGTAGSEGSDWDIVVPVTAIVKVESITKDRFMHRSAYCNGFYVEDYNGDILNVIPVHPNEYEGWLLTTKMMTTLLQEKKIGKEFKYFLFETIKNCFKFENQVGY